MTARMPIRPRVARGPAASEASRRASASVRRIGPPQGRLVRLLLADGSEGEFRLLIETLEVPGIDLEVRWAATVDEALEALAAGPRDDLVIVDPILPGGDGWEVVTAAGAERVVVTLAGDDPAIRRRAADLGVVAAVDKPRLAETLAGLLESR